MEKDGIQLFRTAALELQCDNGDLIRVAGIVQKVKDWFNIRKNKKTLKKEIIEPVENVFKRLENAVTSQDRETFDQIVSQELPSLLSKSVSEAESLRDKMLSQPVEYVSEKGELLSGNNLGWVAKNYQKDKSLVEKLWDLLPEQFRSEVPIGQRINQPISNFSWYNSYGPQDIVITSAVKNNLWSRLGNIFDSKTL